MGWLHNSDEWERDVMGPAPQQSEPVVPPTIEEAMARLAPLFEKEILIRGAFRLKSREIFPSPMEGPSRKYSSVDEYARALATALLKGTYCKNWNGGEFKDNCSSISWGSQNPIIGKLVLAMLGK